MEPLLYHKTLYQKKQDAMAADFIKPKLPYRAKIELRIAKYVNVQESGAWRSVKVPNFIYGTITGIDHVDVWFHEDGDKEARKISFEYVNKIHPYEKPQD